MWKSILKGIKRIERKDMYKMKSSINYVEDNLICIDNGYKPSNYHKWGPGVRDLYSLHYVIDGKGYFITNNETYRLQAGQSFLIYPQTEVYYYPDYQEPWEYIWIDFKGEEVLRLLSMTNFSKLTPVSPFISYNLEPLFHIIETSGKKVFERERYNARLRLLLSYYMEYYPKPNVIIKIDHVLLTKNYIENNYWKNTLTIVDIVDYINIERTYLFRLFKEATGMSVLKYLTLYRIQRGCELLKNTELSVKSIAYSVGYKDQLYFTKVFKKLTSYSPTEYRQKEESKME
jgi:AraC-like DNA-binding protein